MRLGSAADVLPCSLKPPLFPERSAGCGTSAAKWTTGDGPAGSYPKSLSRWTVRDRQGHVYKFPEGYKLGYGKTVTVHTGSG